MKSCQNTQKKRNVGLIYEFLLRTISRSLVENDQKKSSASLKIIKKYFKHDTELYREFRLFNSLLKTTVSSDATASSIIGEAKGVVRSFDFKKLQKEKTYLIHEINKTISDDSFYDQPISEYKMYSTIGTLFNAWREPLKHDLSKIAQYEDKLVEWLKKKKDAIENLNDNSESPGFNRLVFKLMTKKMNDKYGATLNDDQKSLVREYALYSMTGSESNISIKLEEIKRNLISTIQNSSYMLDLPEYTKEKLKEVLESVKNDSDEISDSKVSKYMTYIKLINELKTGGESHG